MAGAFGFERKKYGVSLAVGEHGVLPRVREADGALVLADGFSCRTQIAQRNGREALHLAQALRLGLGGGDPTRRPALPLRARAARGAAAVVAVAALAALAVSGRRAIARWW
jgi:hypothetical protein